MPLVERGNNLHVILIADTEANENEAVHHDDSDTEGHKECKYDRFHGVIDGRRGQGADAGRLDGDGADNLPPLVLQLGTENDVDTTN